MGLAHFTNHFIIIVDRGETQVRMTRNEADGKFEDKECIAGKISAHVLEVGKYKLLECKIPRTLPMRIYLEQVEAIEQAVLLVRDARPLVQYLGDPQTRYHAHNR